MGKNVWPKRARATVFKIRYRDSEGPKSKLVISENGKVPKVKVSGKVLSITKVPFEELFHLDTFNFLPKNLMNEFRRSSK